MPTVGLKRDLLFQALGQTFTEEQVDCLDTILSCIFNCLADLWKWCHRVTAGELLFKVQIA